MRVRSSLKAAKKNKKSIRVVRKGRVYYINKENRKLNTKQD